MYDQLLGEYFAIFVSALAACSLSAIERWWPNKKYRFDWLWIARALSLALAGVMLTILTGNGFESTLKSFALFPLLSERLNTFPAWASGFVGYLGVTFFVYWWHRARHASSLLWRLFHQVHHSPHRIEAVTAFYAHPADFLCNTLIVNVVAYSLLGLNINGAVWATIWVGVFELWEHTNIRTPRWLGYVVVRPEMHRVHHERDRHTNNFGLPVWDMVFGTYENSLRQVECGFDADKERQLAAMLACRDVHKQGRAVQTAG
jgi:sterol desaturase/sphingolipid hydroxylase (fatty acid hydroxylase superfamily)